MAEMTDILKARLARSLESKLRHELSIMTHIQGWGIGTVNFLARWIYDQRTPESPYTFLQYYNLARSVVRNARDAATMQANPSMTIMNLAQSPGQPAALGRYEYRTVVVGRDASGEETFSTLVHVYSDRPLTGSEVTEQAESQYSAPTVPPGFSPVSPPTVGQVVKVEVYIVSAGRAA